MTSVPLAAEPPVDGADEWFSSTIAARVAAKTATGTRSLAMRGRLSVIDVVEVLE
jgi:hypothetical protein